MLPKKQTSFWIYWITTKKEIGDPDKTLKDIEPLIDTIKKDASQLLAEAENALPADGELKRIAREAAVTANVEYLKFYRGDYI